MLVAESDMAFAGMLVHRLAANAARLRIVGVSGECDGASALAKESLHDLILLGNVSCGDGEGIVERLRAVTPAPIVALVGTGSPLDAGADVVQELSGFIPRGLDQSAIADSLFEIALLAGATDRH